MPNTFGPPGGGLPLFDPRYERGARQRFGRPGIAEVEWANSFYLPIGRWPARGWLLMRAKEYRQLNTYATNHQLILQDFATPAGPVTLSNLAIVQARCVSRGVAADPGAIFLVEVTDLRGVLANRWFAAPLTASFNVRAPAYPGQYYTPSTNGGTAWTWNTMVGQLWALLGLLGAYPGLPVAPAATPENFWYPGTGGWAALCDVLELLGCAVSVDLTKAAPYGIVAVGAADAAFTAVRAKYAGFMEDSLEWIDTGAGRVPGQVVVYFHSRYTQYGTEETVRMDALQWSQDPFYPVTIAGTGGFANAPGTGYLWDDFTVRLDVDGNPLVADVAMAQTIAQERVNQYYAHLYRGTVGFLTERYTGALPFATGSLVDGVCWRQDMREPARSAWTTEIVRGPAPPWPEVIDGR